MPCDRADAQQQHEVLEAIQLPRLGRELAGSDVADYGRSRMHVSQ